MNANPYAPSDQVFVVMRFDAVAVRARPPESALHVLKALWSSAAAEAEVTRLTELNREVGMVYFWKAARLARQETPSATV